VESIVATEPSPMDTGRDRPSHPDRGPRGHIGWVVAGSLGGGLLLVGSGAPVDQLLNRLWPPAMLALAVWMLVWVHRQPGRVIRSLSRTLGRATPA